MFSKIGTQKSNNVPTTNTKFSSYMPLLNYTVFFLEQVSSHDISSAIKKLKAKVSFGHGGISTKIMKETIENILATITQIINQSISKGVIHDLMKVAKVIPIHKSSDPCL